MTNAVLQLAKLLSVLLSIGSSLAVWAINKMAVASLNFPSAFEEDLDKVLID